MQDPQGRELLLEAGAWESNTRIKIPENLVTDAIANAPSRIPMHDRLGNLTMPLELGKVFFGSGSDTTFTLDVETGERRPTTAQDVENIAQSECPESRFSHCLVHLQLLPYETLKRALMPTSPAAQPKIST